MNGRQNADADPLRCFGDFGLLNLLREMSQGDDNAGYIVKAANHAEEALPRPLSATHSNDREWILYQLGFGCQSVLLDRLILQDERHSRADLKAIDVSASVLVKLLARLPAKVESSDLSEVWTGRLAAVKKNRVENRAENDVAIDLTTNEPRLDVLDMIQKLSTLAWSARTLGEIYTTRVPNHRPRDGTLPELADSAALAWSALSLLAASSVKHSFPTTRNGGQTWCLQVIQFAAAERSGWRGDTLSWSEGTILKEIREAVSALKNELNDGLNTESREVWDAIGLDSITGLRLMDWATGAVHPSTIKRALDFLDDYLGIYPPEDDGWT